LNADFAIDTNVAIYAFSDDNRNSVALRLIEASPRLSVQLLNEFVAVSIRKRKVPWDEIEESLQILKGLAASVRPVAEDVHTCALSLAQNYKLSFYDALMLSAALLDGCKVFYSEDMQHEMIIDGILTITNPFLQSEIYDQSI
jgi:predicted nucleic acid-binding protein